jgi:hypothetical protein
VQKRCSTTFWSSRTAVAANGFTTERDASLSVGDSFGRRAERLGRFPSSRPAASLRGLGAPAEMTGTDTKSRGARKGAIAQSARRSPRDPSARGSNTRLARR